MLKTNKQKDTHLRPDDTETTLHNPEALKDLLLKSLIQTMCYNLVFLICCLDQSSHQMALLHC